MGQNANLLIVWTDLNQTGIPIIDEQHRGIVSIINSFHYVQADERGSDFLEPTANMITEYTKIHFATEADLLEQSDYPDLDNHLKLHHHLITSSKLFAFESKKKDDPRVYLNFLKSWWIHHINEEDKKYCPHLLKYLGIM